MKILLINDYKDKIGGAEIHLYAVMDELVKRGNKVKLFASDISSEGYSYRTKNISLINYANRLFNISAYLKVKKFAQSFKPDIIHVHGIFNELSPSVIYALKAYPIIMTVHNNQLISPLAISASATGNPCKEDVCRGCLNCVGVKGTLFEYVKRIVHSFLLKPVLLYICPSSYMTKLLQQKGFANTIHIENGISPLDFKPIYNFDSILYVGQLIKVKGIEVLLRSMQRVVKKITNSKLVIAGDGADKQYFIYLARKLGLQKNVQFPGSVSRSNINGYYNDSTFIVVPSIIPDNFPTVCLEAMCTGRPVIATTVGGIPEIVINGKSGYLVDANDIQTMSERMITLLSDKRILAHMSNYSREHSSRYSLVNHIDKLTALYKKTLLEFNK